MRPLSVQTKCFLTAQILPDPSGFPVRWLIALERGQIQDLSLPKFARLSKGLGLDTVGFMKELEKGMNLRFNAD